MSSILFKRFSTLRFINPLQTVVLALLFTSLIVIFFASIFLGSFDFSFEELFNDSNSLDNIVLLEIRIPRVFGTLILPISAIIGASLVISLLYLFTQGFGYQGITYMLLVGIAVNAFASVGIGILTYISTDSELRGLTFWTMGSFGGASWQLIMPALIIISLTMLWMIPSSRKLDLLQLGEPEAYRLGVNVKKLKFKVIISSAVTVGISVSLSGMIGFVGLVVPHLVRLIGGVNHNYLLPGSALLGASLMMTADLLSRTLIQPAELPVGLITSAIGAPFFLWLIFRIRKS